MTGSQFLDGGCWEKVGDLFQGDSSFYIKDKLKSDWQKSGMRVKDNKNYYGGLLKNLAWSWGEGQGGMGGGGECVLEEKTICSGNCFKREGFDSLQI